MSNQINPLVITCAQFATYNWACKQTRYTTFNLHTTFASFIACYSTLSFKQLYAILNIGLSIHNQNKVDLFALHYDLF